MSATYRCDICKDPDLNATHTFYPNFPVRRYEQGGGEYSNDPAMYVGGSMTLQIPEINRNYDLCESCRIRYSELIKKFLGRK